MMRAERFQGLWVRSDWCVMDGKWSAAAAVVVAMAVEVEWLYTLFWVS